MKSGGRYHISVLLLYLTGLLWPLVRLILTIVATSGLAVSLTSRFAIAKRVKMRPQTRPLKNLSRGKLFLRC